MKKDMAKVSTTTPTGRFMAGNGTPINSMGRALTYSKMGINLKDRLSMERNMGLESMFMAMAIIIKGSGKMT
jgi:sulfur transfer protein SufE